MWQWRSPSACYELTPPRRLDACERPVKRVERKWRCRFHYDNPYRCCCVWCDKSSTLVGTDWNCRFLPFYRNAIVFFLLAKCRAVVLQRSYPHLLNALSFPLCRSTRPNLKTAKRPLCSCPPLRRMRKYRNTATVGVVLKGTIHAQSLTRFVSSVDSFSKLVNRKRCLLRSNVIFGMSFTVYTYPREPNKLSDSDNAPSQLYNVMLFRWIGVPPCACVSSLCHCGEPIATSESWVKVLSVRARTDRFVVWLVLITSSKSCGSQDLVLMRFSLLVDQPCVHVTVRVAITNRIMSTHAEALRTAACSPGYKLRAKSVDTKPVF